MSYYYEKAADAPLYHYLKQKPCGGVPMHFHAAYELLLVRRGCVSATVGGEARTLREGDGAFVTPFLPHAFFAQGEGSEIVVLVGADDLFFPVLSSLAGEVPTFFRLENASIAEDALSLYGRQEDEPIRRTLFLGAAACLLSAAVAENGRGGHLPSRADKGMLDAIRYIKEHATEELSLISVAARFGYAPKYFSRRFHELTKTNFSEFVAIARAGVAHLLLDEDRTVTDVAYASGFRSLPSFYRAYRRVFGKTPKRSK